MEGWTRHEREKDLDGWSKGRSWLKLERAGWPWFCWSWTRTRTWLTWDGDGDVWAGVGDGSRRETGKVKVGYGVGVLSSVKGTWSSWVSV